MTGYASVAATRRAFYTVTALRWLPTGLFIPILVLYMTSRGLSLAEVGLATGAQAAVVLLLELPTGGLADALGRRPVLAAASAVAVASTALLLFADDLAGFALAWGLQGVYRALDSGPLDAWYVDAALAVEPDRNLEADLSGAGSVLYGAVATGSLLAGAGSFAEWLPFDPLTTAVAASLYLEVLHLLAVLVLVREVRPGHGLDAARASAADSPRIVREAVQLMWTNRPLRLVLAVELSWGAGLSCVELLWQPRTAALLGSAEDTLLFGLMGAGGWMAGAVGAALLPLLIRLFGGRVAHTAAIMRIAQGATVLGMAVAGGLAGVIASYVAFYAVHGASNPAHYALLHRRVGAGHRTTVLSANSLVSTLSGLPAGIGFGLLADLAGLPTALVVGAALLAAAAPLYLLAGEPPRPDTAAATGPAGGAAGDTAGEASTAPA